MYSSVSVCFSLIGPFSRVETAVVLDVQREHPWSHAVWEIGPIVIHTTEKVEEGENTRMANKVGEHESFTVRHDWDHYIRREN